MTLFVADCLGKEVLAGFGKKKRGKGEGAIGAVLRLLKRDMLRSPSTSFPCMVQLNACQRALNIELRTKI